MPDINRTKTVFIREGTPLPKPLSMESKAFLPGWRIVKNLDRQALTREIEAANWNFFYLAGEIRATVFGRERPGALRRAVKRVLAKQEGALFNSLEITRIVSKWFLGIPFLTVAAHSRHIQQSVSLIPAKDFVLRMRAAAPESSLDDDRPRHAELATGQYRTLISSS
jgi:hypothetical protein